MTFGKRLSDVICAVILSVFLLPLAVVIAAVLLICDGRPVFYISERMKSPDKGFNLWKFRTMSVSSTDGGVSGGDKAARITKTGQFLRRYRLDEIPQLWNVLRGDISFVGPRPPLRRYVEQFPDTYREVLRSRPGITGMATLAFHRTEERLLRECNTAAETEAVYTRRCVPRKARIDLIYAGRRTICSDFKLMVATIFRRISLH